MWTYNNSRYLNNNDWLSYQDELYHWKYLKKIGDRYFYSLDELKAYYNDATKSAEGRNANTQNSLFMSKNRQLADIKRDRQRKYRYGSATKDEDYARTQKLFDKWYKQSEKNVKAKYKAKSVKLKIKSKVDPIASTADFATSKIRNESEKKRKKKIKKEADRYKKLAQKYASLGTRPWGGK